MNPQKLINELLDRALRATQATEGVNVEYLLKEVEGFANQLAEILPSRYSVPINQLQFVKRKDGVTTPFPIGLDYENYDVFISNEASIFNRLAWAKSDLIIVQDKIAAIEQEIEELNAPPVPEKDSTNPAP